MKSKQASYSGLWILLYMFVFSFSQQLSMALVTWYTMDQRKLTLEQAGRLVRDQQVPVVLAISALIGLPLMFLIMYKRKIPWEQAVWQKKISLKKLAGLFLGGILINQIAGIFLYLLQLLPGLDSLFLAYQESMETMVPEQDPRQLIILLGLIVPIYEEVLFRGLIFREFAVIAPVKLAIAAQAILFGVWHSTIIQGLYAFILGIVLCRVYLRHQSIWAACAVHCGFNTANFLLLYFLR